MGTRIERDLGFSTAIHFSDTFILNEYFMTLSILVETDNIKDQNIALERILHFITVVLNNCLFINERLVSCIGSCNNRKCLTLGNAKQKTGFIAYGLGFEAELTEKCYDFIPFMNSHLFD
jgi:hypothetical protein